MSKEFLHILGQYEIPVHYLERHFTHSSGAGGQNVNKVATKVQLKFMIATAPLPAELKYRLMAKFPEGHIEQACQDTRHQHLNLEIALNRLEKKINDALKVQKKRVATKPFYKTKAGKKAKIKAAHLSKWRESKLR